MDAQDQLYKLAQRVKQTNAFRLALAEGAFAVCAEDLPTDLAAKLQKLPDGTTSPFGVYYVSKQYDHISFARR
jgi:hypothetical protein